MSKKSLYLFFLVLFILSLIASSSESFNSISSKCSWPVPNCQTITSYFGFRIHPTTFKNSYHSGIDIAAPEGSFIHSICNGIVQFTKFNGPYGYSIIIKNQNFEIVYAHVSPKFIVGVNQEVHQNDIIGNVGPKYIDDFPSNRYYDSNRKSNKWQYNWSSLTSNNKKRRQRRQSFRFLLNILHILFVFFPI